MKDETEHDRCERSMDGVCLACWREHARDLYECGEDPTPALAHVMMLEAVP